MTTRMSESDSEARACPEQAERPTSPAHVYVDGASIGNPGPAGVGVVIRRSQAEGQEPLRTAGEAIGVATNNEAEYRALIRGLEECRRLGLALVRIHMDSELVVKQMSGEYRVKDPKLLPLYMGARELLESFREARICLIRREENKLANNLAQNAARSEQARLASAARPEHVPQQGDNTACAPRETQSPEVGDSCEGRR
jgi:ribonuclease HI